MSSSLSFCQGETPLIQMSIQYAGGGPVNVTGYTIVWVLTAKRGTPALVTKSTTAGTLTILLGPAGSIQWSLTSAETNALAAGSYAHEVHIKSPAPGSQQYCVLHGRVDVGESSIGTI